MPQAPDDEMIHAGLRGNCVHETIRLTHRHPVINLSFPPPHRTHLNTTRSPPRYRSRRCSSAAARTKRGNPATTPDSGACSGGAPGRDARARWRPPPLWRVVRTLLADALRHRTQFKQQHHHHHHHHHHHQNQHQHQQQQLLRPSPYQGWLSHTARGPLRQPSASSERPPSGRSSRPSSRPGTARAGTAARRPRTRQSRAARRSPGCVRGSSWETVGSLLVGKGVRGVTIGAVE
jgi:hypothetical protein